MTTSSAGAVKRLHDKRRALKVCINNETHGPAVKSGRCAECWAAKLKQQNASRRAAREAARE